MSIEPHPPQRGIGVDENWSTLWDGIAAEIPDRIAVIAPGETLTYAQLEDAAARLAGWLAAHGVARGTKVGILLYNRAEYLIAIYAAFKLGSVPVNLNFRYKPTEISALLQISGADTLIYAGSLAAGVATASDLLGRPITLVEVDDAGTTPLPGAYRFAEASASDRLESGQPISGDDEIYIFTGGTTGLPKAVVQLHSSLFDSQLVSTYGALGIDFPVSLDEVVAIAANPVIPAPRTLPITPLMHAMAMYSSMDTLLLGGSVVFLNSAQFDPGLTLRCVAEHRIDRLIIAGNAIAAPLVEELDRAAAAGLTYDTSSLSIVMSSGMAWTDSAKAGLLRHLDAQLFDIVGSSEGGPYAYSSVWSEADLPSHLRLAAGAVVLDDDGGELDPESGAVGRLAYKGPMPRGYFDDPVKTAEVYLQYGPYRYVVPGDYVRLLGERRIEFLGRGSAVVNTGGEKVFPAEVEEQILAHPAVGDCAVFGVADDRWGQVVAAVVATHPGHALDAAALGAHLTSRLAGYKKPRLVVFVASLDRSPTGKLDLRALTALVTSAHSGSHDPAKPSVTDQNDQKESAREH